MNARQPRVRAVGEPSAEALERVERLLRAELARRPTPPRTAHAARILAAVEGRRRAPVRLRRSRAAAALAVLAVGAALVLGPGRGSGAEAGGGDATVRPAPDPTAAAHGSRPLTVPSSAAALGRLVGSGGSELARIDLEEPLRDEGRRIAADVARLVGALTECMPGPMRQALSAAGR